MKLNNINITEIKTPVVVTGAFGFIGHRIVDALIELGITEIVAFDLPGFEINDTWQGKVKYVAGDIANKSDVDSAMNNAGTVVHLAAMVGDWVPIELHDKVTINGSEFIFDAAVKHNARVVLSSSVVVYGDNLPNQTCDEEKEWGKSLGPYSISKQKQEKLAWEYHNNKGMKLTIIRPGTVYGPGSKPWVHDVVETLQTGVPALVSGGEFNAGLVYVDNLVQMFLLAATKDAALGQVFNGGDGSTTTWKTYMTDVAKVLNINSIKSTPLWIVKPVSSLLESVWHLFNIKTRPPITRESLNIVCGAMLIPISKAENLLGYNPEINYDEGKKQVEKYILKNFAIN